MTKVAAWLAGIVAALVGFVWLLLDKMREPVLPPIDETTPADVQADVDAITDRGAASAGTDLHAVVERISKRD